MFERFTPVARQAVVRAQEHARSYEHNHIGAGLLLLGVVDDELALPARVLIGLGVDLAVLAHQVEVDGVSDASALASLGIDLDEVRRRAEETFGLGALDRPRRQRTGLFGKRRAGGGGHIPFDDEAKASLEGALREAVALGDREIGTEHMLLGLLASRPGTTGATLRRAGTALDDTELRARVVTALGHAA